MPSPPTAHPAPDERHWIARIRAGDTAAFERLFRHYHPRLCTFACRYVESREVAQEVVQDVFARLWAERERLVVRGSLKSLLYTSVRNHAISHLRHQLVERRWREGGGSPGQGHAADSAERHATNDAVERLQSEELGAAIQRVLDGLPQRCRLALMLRWQRQMSYAEVAETMGISVKTVEIYITRGIAALRENYQALLPYR